MADAQFAIDVASRMTGGNETLAELDALTASMTGAGKNADFFQDALKRVGRDLAGAEAAAKLANDALSAGEKEFALLERAARQAAVGLEKGAKALEWDSEELAALSAKSTAAAAALTAQKTVMAGLEASAKAANAPLAALTNTQKNLQTLNSHVNKSIGEQAEGFEKLRNALSSSGGALGQLASSALAPAQAFAKLSGEMGATKAAALIATTAIIAITAALIAGTVATLAWAVGLADANRTAMLATQAAEAMDPALVGLRDTFAEVTHDTGQNADALRKLESQLKAAKVSAKDMPAALLAAADAATALGDSGVSSFIESIKAGKQSVSALASDVQAKLGGIVAKQMLGLSAQSQRLKDNFAATFGGLNIDGALEALSNFIGDFDQTTALGKELKATFEAIFQPFLDGAVKAAQGFEGFALQVAILGVKVYIALKPWGELFDALGVAIAAAGIAFAVTFAPAVWAGVVALGALIASAAVAAAPFIAIGLAVAAVYEAFTHWDDIKKIFGSVVDYIKGISFADLGTQIILGLANGITGGLPQMLAAVGGVVGGAIDFAKSKLGIHSPSTVFADIGDNTAAGFAGGVEGGTPDAHEAVTTLVSPTDSVKQAALSGDVAGAGLQTAASSGAAASAPAPAAPASGGAGNFSGAIFNFYGVEGAEDALDRFKEMLTLTREGDLAALGGAVASG